MAIGDDSGTGGLVELLLVVGPGDGLCRLMRGDALVGWVGSLDEARARAADIGARLALTTAALEQLRMRAAVPAELPPEVRLAE